MAELTWDSRELPILEEVAAAEAVDQSLTSGDLVERTGITEAQVGRGLAALIDGDFIQAVDVSSGGGKEFLEIELRERGRRAVGAWPPDVPSFAAFMDAVAAQIESAPDEEAKSKLRRLLEAAGGVGKEITTAVLVEYAKQASGVG